MLTPSPTCSGHHPQSGGGPLVIWPLLNLWVSLQQVAQAPAGRAAPSPSWLPATPSPAKPGPGGALKMLVGRGRSCEFLLPLLLLLPFPPCCPSPRSPIVQVGQHQAGASGQVDQLLPWCSISLSMGTQVVSPPLGYPPLGLETALRHRPTHRPRLKTQDISLLRRDACPEHTEQPPGQTHGAGPCIAWSPLGTWKMKVQCAKGRVAGIDTRRQHGLVCGFSHL
jgi:hypothetical protein